MKLKFPMFWGENPTTWIYRANQYFKYYNVSPNEQLVLASFHMDGEALVWYQDCEEFGIFDRWETMVQALLLNFGTTSFDKLQLWQFSRVSSNHGFVTFGIRANHHSINQE